MIRSHNSLILKRVFSGPFIKKSKIIPKDFIHKHKFSPIYRSRNIKNNKITPTIESNKQILDKLKNKHELSSHQVPPLKDPK